MKRKRITVELQSVKAGKSRRQKYLKTIVEPAERLADLVVQLQKGKTATSRLRSAWMF